MLGRLDRELLSRPDIGESVFITGDKGFGDWIFNKGLPRPGAVLFSRLPHPMWAETARRLISLLAAGVVPGHMITITKQGERIKPFPIGAHDG